MLFTPKTTLLTLTAS